MHSVEELMEGDEPPKKASAYCVEIVQRFA